MKANRDALTLAVSAPWATTFNPLKPELNSSCYLLALLGAHHFSPR